MRFSMEMRPDEFFNYLDKDYAKDKAELACKSKLERVTWLSNVVVMAYDCYELDAAKHGGLHMDDQRLLKRLESELEAEKNRPIESVRFFKLAVKPAAMLFLNIMRSSSIDQLRKFVEVGSLDVISDTEWDPPHPY